VKICAKAKQALDGQTELNRKEKPPRDDVPIFVYQCVEAIIRKDPRALWDAIDAGMKFKAGKSAEPDRRVSSTSTAATPPPSSERPAPR
jgi:hypothetical protein